MMLPVNVYAPTGSLAPGGRSAELVVLELWAKAEEETSKAASRIMPLRGVLIPQCCHSQVCFAHSECVRSLSTIGGSAAGLRAF
jgi:hypothetical protein